MDRNTIVSPFAKGTAVRWQPNPTAPVLTGTFLRMHPRTAAFAIVCEASRPTHQAIVSTRLLQAA